mmetsp:Transcript_45820/g.146107  ORF Transcript_45820/g.146107 Transcript_45820/m.146107 type:complete len:266 (+) Transcript_45820:872-1669(+)
MLGSSLRVTWIDLHTSLMSSSRTRISSPRLARSISPWRITSSWILDFSYRMHSSSLRSISMMPVRLRFSTWVSYCFLRRSISFSVALIIALSLSTSAICSSTTACRSLNSSAHLLRSARWWSLSILAVPCSRRAFPSSRSLATLSVRRMSISFVRILSFSFISAMDWLLAWMRLTNLLRWFLTRSYSCWKSLRRRSVSFFFFFRSMMMRSLTRTASTASLHLATLDAACMDIRAFCAESSVTAASRACSSRFITTTSFSSSTTSA